MVLNMMSIINKFLETGFTEHLRDSKGQLFRQTYLNVTQFKKHR